MDRSGRSAPPCPARARRGSDEAEDDHDALPQGRDLLVEGELCLLLPGGAGPQGASLPGLALSYLPGDFTQTHWEVNAALVSRALEWLHPAPDEHALDLFCGIGNFTLPLARCAHTVHALCDDAAFATVCQVLITETGTLGIRATRVERWPQRREETKVDVDGQTIRVKVAAGRVKVEHDDAAAAAKELGIPLREVLRRAEAQATEPRKPVWASYCGRLSSISWSSSSVSCSPAQRASTLPSLPINTMYGNDVSPKASAPNAPCCTSTLAGISCSPPTTVAGPCWPMCWACSRLYIAWTIRAIAASPSA